MDPWFFWLLAGIICIGLELVIPGLVIIFFGFGAIITAVFTLIPVIDGNLWVQVIIFIVSSLSSLVFLRRKFKPVFKGRFFDSSSNKNSDLDGFAEVIGDILEGSGGRIKYKGTTWTAFSKSGDIPAGTRVKIIRKQGMSYIVESI